MNQIDEAIVLAGGFGTRLRSVVSDVPKPLAPVAGRPFLDWLFDDLQRKGLKRLILATGFGSDQIEARYRRGYNGLSVLISRETDPLGTGGAIKLASKHATSKHVLVVNGDTFAAWSPDSLVAVASATMAPITIGLKHLENPDRYGTVALDGHIIRGFHEKRSMASGIINAGLYLINPSAIPWPVATRFSFERDLLEPACSMGTLAGVVMDGPFIDIGVPEAFLDAQTVIPLWVG